LLSGFNQKYDGGSDNAFMHGMSNDGARRRGPNVNSGWYWSGPRQAAVSSAQTDFSEPLPDAQVIHAEYTSIQDSYSKKKLPGDF
jgi:hypothetical protein